MDSERALAEIVAEYAPAQGIDDIDTALRLITCLRQKMKEMGEEAQPVDGEYTVFLDEEHDRMLQRLYNLRKLAPEQENDAYNEEYEFDEVFTDFVQGSIDLAWDMAKDENLHPIQKPKTA